MLGQFNLQKFVSSIKDKDNDKESGLVRSSEFSWMQSIGRHLRHKSLYALGFCSELLLTPDDTILVSFEASGDKMTPPRKKAVFHHKASVYLFVLLYYDYWVVFHVFCHNYSIF